MLFRSDLEVALHKARGRIAFATRSARLIEEHANDLSKADAETARAVSALLLVVSDTFPKDGERRARLPHTSLRAALTEIGRRYGSIARVEIALTDDPQLDRLGSNRFIEAFVDEAMANAWRHGGDNVRLAATVDGSDVRVTVADDGEGFELHAVERGQGLQILEDCAECMGGDVEVRRSPLTTVVLRFPVEEAE